MTIKPDPETSLENLAYRHGALATNLGHHDEETLGEYLAWTLKQVIEWIYDGDPTDKRYLSRITHKSCAVAWVIQPESFQGQSPMQLFSQRGFGGNINYRDIYKYAREMREMFGLNPAVPPPPQGKESFIN